MTGDRLVWCTREEFAGNAPFDPQTNPPSYRHRRWGICPCGHEHGAESERQFLPVEEVLGLLAQEPAQVADHEVYAYALGTLDLRKDAFADLSRRGLSLEVIAKVGYRSVPLDSAARTSFLATLIDRFGEDRLRACAGFVNRYGKPSFWTGAGYVVPYVDEQGHITGLQRKEIGGKYLTARGAKATKMYHLAGPRAGIADLVVTEGGLKAEVAFRLGGTAAFGVPGQSLSVPHLEAIKRLQPARVIVALDREANAGTGHARTRWIKALFDAGLPVYEAVWDGQDVSGPKGLDDLLLAGGRPRIRKRAVTPRDITQRRVPSATDIKGAITTGLPLEEARQRTQQAIAAFLAGHRPGRARALLVRSSPGVGKTHAVGQGLHRAATARILVGNIRLAQEQAAAFGYGVVRGRNPENCQRFDVADALAKAGHDVARLACGTVDEPRCLHRAHCAYWQQFAQPGTLVAATEQLFNPAFIRPASAVVVDDADLPRSLIDRHSFSLQLLNRAVQQLKDRQREPVRRLLVVLATALIEPLPHPLVGPAVWDHLAWAAALRGQSLATLIAALPKGPTLPGPVADETGCISLDAVAEAPPASIGHLLRTLQEELPSFLSHEDFNSRLRLSPLGLDVWRLRKHTTDELGRTYVDHADLLVLDATPVDALVDHLTRRHERLPDIHAEVALPPTVKVVQYAERPNGHRALQDDAQLDGVLAQIERERSELPARSPHEEAVIGYRGCRAPFLAAGFTDSQVLTFGSARGTNALAGVNRLHVVGRPMPPAQDLAYLAQVIYHAGPPISEQLALVPRAYGGQPYQGATVDFVDRRVSELLRACRDDEVLQAVHRARAVFVDRQLQLGDEPIDRRPVTLVLHTSHVVPGLRVDELRLSSPRATVNEERASDAAARIERAIATLHGRGEEVTVAAVSRAAQASRQTVAKHLRLGAHTLQRDSLYRCVQVAGPEPETAHPSASVSLEAPRIEPRPTPPGRVWCCDELVYPDQRCRECADKAAQAVAAKRRPNKLRFPPMALSPPTGWT